MTWKKVILGDIVTLQRGYDLPEQDRCPGQFSVVGSAGPNGFHDKANVSGPGVVVGRSGAGFGTAHFCEADFWALNTGLFVSDFRGNDPHFVYYLLDYLDFTKYNSGGAQPSLNRNFIYPIPVTLPPLAEQIRIARMLSTWDVAIGKKEQLIEAKERWFSWLLKRLITSDKHPRRHIRDFTTEVSKRNSGGVIDRVLSVTNNRGFVLPEDQFERRVASSNLNNYKIITRGQYAYNPSRINVGSIARLYSWEKGVLSPMYVVFKLSEKKVNNDFFLHWLSSHEAKERIRKSAQGSVRETVSFTDLAAIPFPLPPLEQQQQIATTLNIARQEIDLLKKQAESYLKQKRGLMQKLLSGQWRVENGEEVENG